jgi:ketosteroid isomerase-like protein
VSELKMEITPSEVARAFVDRINAHDVPGLVALMTADHRFVDSLGNVVDGREAMKGGWAAYFGMVPDYKLATEQWLADGSTAVLLGTASGTYSPDDSLDPKRRWTTPVACRAVVHGNEVAEWRIYADNEPIRQLMRGA